MVDGRSMIRMVLEHPVIGQMTVDDSVDVSLFLAFMHVLGRRDGQGSHHDTQHEGEQPGQFHTLMVCRPAGSSQLNACPAIEHAHEQHVGPQQDFVAAVGFVARTKALMMRPSSCASVVSVADL